VEEAKHLMPSGGMAPAPATGSEPIDVTKESSVQEKAQTAEEPSGSSGTGWIWGGVIALLLGLGFWWFRRR